MLGGLKRGRILIALVLAVVAACVFLVWPRGPKEPVYQGKKLSEWIQEEQTAYSHFYLNLSSYEPTRLRREAALQAIEAVGTNALPWLLFQLGRLEPKWHPRFNRWADGGLPPRFRFETRAKRIEMAAAGFRYLGADVAPAVPALAGLLDDPECGGYAALAMTEAGELALPYLLKALASTNAFIATHALQGLTTLARTVESALPPILQTLQHTNKAMREWVLYFVTDFKSRPDLVVPALTGALSDPDDYVKRLASVALAKRGDAARSALPELRQLMAHSDPKVAGVARNAVQDISAAGSRTRRE